MDYELARQSVGEYVAMFSNHANATGEQAAGPMALPDNTENNHADARTRLAARLARELGHAVAVGDIASVAKAWSEDGDSEIAHQVETAFPQEDFSGVLIMGRAIIIAAQSQLKLSSPQPVEKLRTPSSVFDNRKFFAYLRKVVTPWVGTVDASREALGGRESRAAIKLPPAREVTQFVAENLILALASTYDVSDLSNEEKEGIRYGVNELHDVRISLRRTLDLLVHRQDLAEDLEIPRRFLHKALTFAFEAAAAATQVRMHADTDWLNSPAITEYLNQISGDNPGGPPKTLLLEAPPSFIRPAQLMTVVSPNRSPSSDSPRNLSMLAPAAPTAERHLPHANEETRISRMRNGLLLGETTAEGVRKHDERDETPEVKEVMNLF